MDKRESLAAALSRPRSVGEVLTGALSCYRRYPALFTELTLAVVLPYALVVVLVGGGGLLGNQHRSASSLLVVFLLDSLIVGPLISALHMHAVVLIRDDQDPHLGDVLMRGVKVLPTVAAAQVVAALGVAFGFGVVVIVIVTNLVLTQVGRAAVGSTAEWVQVLVGVVVESIALSFTALSTAVLFFDLLTRSSGVSTP